LFKNSQPFRKNYQKTSGGEFFWRTLYMLPSSAQVFDLGAGTRSDPREFVPRAVMSSTSRA